MARTTRELFKITGLRGSFSLGSAGVWAGRGTARLLGRDSASD